MRECIHVILNVFSTIQFPFHERDLFPCYLNFLKESSIHAAIFFQDSSGKITKKFKASYTPMICLQSCQVQKIFKAFSNLSECHVTYSHAGYSDLSNHTQKDYIPSLEKLHDVRIQVYSDFTRIRGCFLHPIQAVENKLLKAFTNT